MNPILDEELLTVAEAAARLDVSPSTIWRWIDRGDLPAYRVGRRRIRLKPVDLARLITPARRVGDGAKPMDQEGGLSLGPLSDQEREQMLAAVEEARHLQAELLSRRSGKPFSPSEEILGELREQRTRDLR